MLKAYIVSENRNFENSVLVFAETPNKAKQKALQTENLETYEYIELTAKRAKYADGHENDSERDLMILNIREGGWWYQLNGKYIDSENLDEAIEQGYI